MVIDSGIRHSNVGGGYAARRAECRRAADLLGVPQLRDADLAMLERVRLPDPLDRRARHVVTENLRVLETAAALRRGDLAVVSAPFAASHASMRDDFEISVPEIDLLVSLAVSRAVRARSAADGRRFRRRHRGLGRSGHGCGRGDEGRSEYEARAHRQARVLLP